MKYSVIRHFEAEDKGFVEKPNQKDEFMAMDDAKQFVAEKYPEWVLVNDDTDGCRYTWGGYHEGVEIFIVAST